VLPDYLQLLTEIVREIQALPSLSSFHLAGGTNLAIQYNHRKSIDIDLISNQIVGLNRLTNIQEEIQNYYKDSCNIKSIIINEELGKQFVFLRLFIFKSEQVIKVELIQNMKYPYEIEEKDGIRFISTEDIGLFKLESAANRKAKKDIYDLDFITDEIPLSELLANLRLKKEKFNLPEHRSIFDLDRYTSPLEKLEILLDFDSNYRGTYKRPSHSNDKIDILPNSKSWQEARISWRMKVKNFIRRNNPN